MDGSYSAEFLAEFSEATFTARRSKLEVWKYFDLGLASVALAQGFGRIGCFLAGCCFEYGDVLRLIHHIYELKFRAEWGSIGSDTTDFQRTGLPLVFLPDFLR